MDIYLLSHALLGQDYVELAIVTSPELAYYMCITHVKEHIISEEFTAINTTKENWSSLLIKTKKDEHYFLLQLFKLNRYDN